MYRKLAALKKAGCKQMFKCDALSGASTKRPALLRCLKKLEPGDNVHTATIYPLSKTKSFSVPLLLKT
jgi:DNA invertase Pin-like site-specific DNA recombinase